MSDVQPTLDGSKQAYVTCESDLDAALKDSDFDLWVRSTAFWGAAEQYINLLEARVSDLEKIIGVINEPVGRDVAAELGHVRGLDMLQWLNGVHQRDIAWGIDTDFPGWRKYYDHDVEPIQKLVDRGYATVEPHSAMCHITEAGRDYLAALKREVHGK